MLTPEEEKQAEPEQETEQEESRNGRGNWGEAEAETEEEIEEEADERSEEDEVEDQGEEEPQIFTVNVNGENLEVGPWRAEGRIQSSERLHKKDTRGSRAEKTCWTTNARI